jgi:hypothetical protein
MVALILKYITGVAALPIVLMALLSVATAVSGFEPK